MNKKLIDNENISKDEIKKLKEINAKLQQDNNNILNKNLDKPSFSSSYLKPETPSFTNKPSSFIVIKPETPSFILDSTEEKKEKQLKIERLLKRDKKEFLSPLISPLYSYDELKKRSQEYINLGLENPIILDSFGSLKYENDYIHYIRKELTKENIQKAFDGYRIFKEEKIKRKIQEEEKNKQFKIGFLLQRDKEEFLRFQQLFEEPSYSNDELKKRSQEYINLGLENPIIRDSFGNLKYDDEYRTYIYLLNPNTIITNSQKSYTLFKEEKRKNYYK
jgi:hypothetical protein